jgi:hypothetical protein
MAKGIPSRVPGKAGGKTRTNLHELAGMPPQLATTQDFIGSNPPLTGRAEAGRKTTKTGRINLKMVAEACIDEGLDPAAEIARALRARVPKLDRQGNLVLDADGNPVYVDAVDWDTRLRTLQELLQYTQPKLKAVEVKMSGQVEMSSEQLDNRLQALIAKAVGTK